MSQQLLAPPATEPPPRLVRPATLSGGRLFLAWTGIVGAGETIGFVFPASAGVAANSMPAVAGLALVLVAGAIEGLVLGAAQGSVLQKVFPRLRRERWIALTTGGAVSAYVLGYVLSYLGGVASSWVIAPIFAVAALLLASPGGAQAIELRHHVRDVDQWVTWTALGWLLGLAAFYLIVTPLWHPGQSAAAAIVVGALAGAVMAAIQAAVTGWCLLRLPAPPRHLREVRR